MKMGPLSRTPSMIPLSITLHGDRERLAVPRSRIDDVIHFHTVAAPHVAPRSSTSYQPRAMRMPLRFQSCSSTSLLCCL